MNVRSFLPVSLLVLVTAFSSCKKEEPEPTPTPTPTPFTNSFSAKVGGVNFNENIFSGLESPGAATIAITASENGSFPSIGLAVPNNITPGTYTFNGAFGTRRGVYNTGSTQNDMYAANSGTGTLTITSHNTSTNQIQGTFSFTASPVVGSSSTNSYNITEGAFAVQYN